MTEKLWFGWVWGFAGFYVLGSGGAGGHRFGGFRTKAHQVGHERSDFEGHLLAFGHGANGFALNHAELIIPGIDLDAATKRQRGDLLGIRFGVHRGAGLQISYLRNAIAEMSAD